VSTIEHIEDEIRKMNAEELAEFRNWFLEFDARQWDEQIEEDANTGKLDKLAENAVTSWRKGKATEL